MFVLEDFLEDEHSVIASIEECFYWFSITSNDYELSFERDVNDRIILVTGDYTREENCLEESQPLSFSFPCSDDVLHSVNDEPGMICFVEPDYNYEEFWFSYGQKYRENKPFLKRVKNGNLVMIFFNDLTRKNVFPESIEFYDNGSVSIVEWCSLEEEEDNVLTGLFYHITGCVSTKTFGLVNHSSLAGVRLSFFNNGKQLQSMTRFTNGMTATGYDEFAYYDNGALSRVRRGVNVFCKASSINNPALVEYTRLGRVQKEEYWINGEHFNSRKEWLNDERVSEYKRELFNKNSIVTNITL